MSELLTCEGLTKSYQKGTNALDSIDLHIGFGRIVGLLGPNGSGKTTLIKLANGLLQPTAGSIKVAGMAPGPDTKAIVSYLLAMSRNARLYLLDEPIGGVDPAARDYILNTILTNYSRDASVILSTHLIEDVEPVLDEAVFLKNGKVFAHRSVEELRETEGMSVDAYFREVFKC